MHKTQNSRNGFTLIEIFIVGIIIILLSLLFMPIILKNRVSEKNPSATTEENLSTVTEENTANKTKSKIIYKDSYATVYQLVTKSGDFFDNSPIYMALTCNGNVALTR